MAHFVLEVFQVKLRHELWKRLFVCPLTRVFPYYKSNKFDRDLSFSLLYSGAVQTHQVPTLNCLYGLISIICNKNKLRERHFPGTIADPLCFGNLKFDSLDNSYWQDYAIVPK